MYHRFSFHQPKQIKYMKKLFFVSFVLIVAWCYPGICQNVNNRWYNHEILEVTDNKTSVLLFPTNIRKVDIGSDMVIAKTVRIGDSEQILRVKAKRGATF